MTDTALEKTEKHKAVPVAAGQHGLQLSSLDEMWRFAQLVHQSGTAPRGMSQQAITIAIQSGLEIGLKPMQALHSIAVINNRAALWGDALPALVQGSGKCKYIKESIDGDGDDMVATCEAARSDNESTNLTRFSVKDAKSAGLWGKAGPWKQYPQRMLQMRARAWCLRDLFADCLRGVGVADEAKDMPAFVPTNQVIVTDDPLLIGATEDA